MKVIKLFCILVTKSINNGKPNRRSNLNGIYFVWNGWHSCSCFIHSFQGERVKYSGEKISGYKCDCMRHDYDCNGDAKSEFDKDQEALINCVEGFSYNMKRKLLDKSKLRSGWDDPKWSKEEIKKQLIKHIEKGDMIDVANFAMFYWNKE